MLSRALVIHRGDSARRAPVDLRDIALDLFDEGSFRDTSPGAEVRLEIGEEAVTVLADTLSLTEAARNLLGNALAHGVSPVTVGADRVAGYGRLWVRDAGPGPSRDLRDRLAERFTAEAAGCGRSTGLGLSIAHAVAEAFGGRLEMETTPQGFRAALVLPLGTGR